MKFPKVNHADPPDEAAPGELEKNRMLAQNGFCLSEAKPQMSFGGKSERFYLVPQTENTHNEKPLRGFQRWPVGHPRSVEQIRHLPIK